MRRATPARAIRDMSLSDDQLSKARHELPRVVGMFWPLVYTTRISKRPAQQQGRLSCSMPPSVMFDEFHGFVMISPAFVTSATFLAERPTRPSKNALPSFPFLRAAATSIAACRLLSLISYGSSLCKIDSFITKNASKYWSHNFNVSIRLLPGRC